MNYNLDPSKEYDFDVCENSLRQIRKELHDRYNGPNDKHMKVTIDMLVGVCLEAIKWDKAQFVVQTPHSFAIKAKIELLNRVWFLHKMGRKHDAT